MKIVFVGQKGVTSWSKWANSPENRAEKIAAELVKRGHTATIVGTPPCTSRRLVATSGIAFKQFPSLNPQLPGGWVYTFLSIFAVWRVQPQVVHLQGWHATALAWLAALAAPQATIVATLDRFPARYHWAARLIAYQAVRVCDAITTPTRNVQYLLLTVLNVRSQYVPDGYTPSTLPVLPLKHWNLKKGYVLLLGENIQTLRHAIQAYATAHSKKKIKKLVVVTSSQEIPAAWAQRYSFLRVVAVQGDRSILSLISGAHTVLITDGAVPQEAVLHAMDSGKSIIAPNTAPFQEILGVTGQYFKAGSIKQLTELLTQAVQGSSKVNTMAQTRARLHFTWRRSAVEYLTLYRREIVAMVPLDSVQPATSISLSAKQPI